MKAVSAWESNEIILDIDGNKTILYQDPEELDRWVHGTVTKGSISLSLEEAKKLLGHLQSAISHYEYIEECAQRDMGE
jgi:hypothetical protein